MDRRNTTSIEPPAVSIADLAARAANLVSSNTRKILGIVGAPGSGKSTLFQSLLHELSGSAVGVEMDGFHLDDSVLQAQGKLERKGASDTFDVEGYVSLLERINQQQEPFIYAPSFNRDLEMSIGGVTPVPRDILLVITEGNYLLNDDGGWQNVRRNLAEIWFIDTPEKIRAERLIARRISHGHSEIKARDWVTNVDLKNGRTVEKHKFDADFVFTIA